MQLIRWLLALPFRLSAAALAILISGEVWLVEKLTRTARWIDPQTDRIEGRR